jgi:TPR repeat protein
MSSCAQANRESAARGHGPEQFFKLGMMCSTGQSMPLDMVAAHKWFNLAALRGSRDAPKCPQPRSQRRNGPPAPG